MSMERWCPPVQPTKQEQFLLRRLTRTKKLFAFLRLWRHEIFDAGFQAELEAMYRASGAGADPVPPALLCMAMLLQSYNSVSDAEAVELSVVDLRWQMVLGCLGSEVPAYGQGTLVDFRTRLMASAMDRRVLERTVEFARRTKAFDWRKLPKSLRVAIDSSPLEGAGRVEDTLNLLAHAARKVAECAAELLGWSLEKVATAAGAPILLETSVKKALDIDWSHADAKAKALDKLVRQVDALHAWVAKHLAEELKKPPLEEHVRTLEQIRSQDLEPDPNGSGRTRIRDGVAPDRRISVEDPEMRHGRKSKSRLFNGYKRHVATDLDTQLIVACAVTPANRPEAEATPALKADIEAQERRIGELHTDLGYAASPAVAEFIADGGAFVCKPWRARNGKGYSKADFKINMRAMTITCPAGETESIQLGSNAAFPATACDKCPLRAECTTATLGKGRTVAIAEDELLQERLRRQAKTRAGRARLRERVEVEHTLAHLGRRQGRRARYKGTRKNLLDVRRAAAVQNIETVQRRLDERMAA